MPPLIRQPNGKGALLAGGVPGNKGGTGRPPNEHVEWCRRVLSDPACETAVVDVLKDPGHAAFATMWRELARRGYGMPAQPLTGPDGGPIAHSVAVTVTRRIVRPGEAA